MRTACLDHSHLLSSPVTEPERPTPSPTRSKITLAGFVLLIALLLSQSGFLNQFIPAVNARIPAVSGTVDQSPASTLMEEVDFKNRVSLQPTVGNLAM